MKTHFKILFLFVILMVFACKTTNNFSADYDDLYYSSKKKTQDNVQVNNVNSNKNTVDYTNSNQKNQQSDVVLNPYYRENKEIINQNQNYTWNTYPDTNELVGELDDRIVYTGSEDEIYFTPEDYTYQYLEESEDADFSDETSYSERLDKFHNPAYNSGYYGSNFYSGWNNFMRPYFSINMQFGNYYNPYYSSWNSPWYDPWSNNYYGGYNPYYYYPSYYTYNYYGYNPSYYSPVYYNAYSGNDVQRTYQRRIDPNRRTRFVQRDIPERTENNLKSSNKGIQYNNPNRRVSDTRIQTNVNNLIENNRHDEILNINRENQEKNRINNNNNSNNRTNNNVIRIEENNKTNNNRIDNNRTNNNNNTDINRTNSNNNRIENNNKSDNNNRSVRTDNTNNTRTTTNDNNRSSSTSSYKNSNNSSSGNRSSSSSSSSGNSSTKSSSSGSSSSSGGGHRK